MRLEGQHEGWPPGGPGAGPEGGKDVLVAAVEAVEIADGNEAAPQRCGNVIEAGEPDETCHSPTGNGCWG